MEEAPVRLGSEESVDAAALGPTVGATASSGIHRHVEGRPGVGQLHPCVSVASGYLPEVLRGIGDVGARQQKRREASQAVAQKAQHHNVLVRPRAVRRLVALAECQDMNLVLVLSVAWSKTM